MVYQHDEGHGQVSVAIVSHNSKADGRRYIELYLDCVISRDNVGLLYHIAAKVKTVKGLDQAGNPEEDNSVRRGAAIST
jgi:hypothetical protein